MKREELLKHAKRLSPETYRRRKIALALELADICMCKHCGNPHRRGFCCRHCGSAMPEGYSEHETVEEIIADSEVYRKAAKKIRRNKT